MTDGLLRLLTREDVPQAMRLKEAAGWNQTEEDWLRLLELEPEGCFAIAMDGRLAATTTALSYGQELAWIGMVLTDALYRGRGLATRLVSEALGFLAGRGVAWVKLDATEMGLSVYRKLGFEVECPIERWVRPAGPVAPRFGTVSLDAFQWDEALDRRAFGAARGGLIARLAVHEAVSVRGAGYAMGRAGSQYAYFGPCVCADAEAAGALVEWYVTRHRNEAIAWDLLPDNPQAVRLAAGFGFACRRRLVRMQRQGGSGARPFVADYSRQYAMADFALG